MDEDVKNVIQDLAWEWHRDKYGDCAKMTFKQLNENQNKIQLLYQVGVNFFYLNLEIGETD